MKKLLFLLVIPLLICVSSRAQHPYIPIPEDSVLWIVVDEDWYEGEPGNPPHTFDYSVYWFENTDTTINGVRYISYFGDSHINMPPSVGNHAAYYGDWFRHDISSKKIWAIKDKMFLDKEQLLYDFSLQVGDTITDSNHYYFTTRIYPSKAWVSQIDSVYWIDGTWRYRWFIQTDGPIWGSAVQIEGMGYTTGFRYDPLAAYHSLVQHTKMVTCFRVKDLWLYEHPNPWNTDCDSLLAKDILLPNSVHQAVNELEMPLLYPNPATNDFLIFNSYAGRKDEGHTIKAYNNLGQQVLSTSITPGSTLSLANHSLQQRLYFFKIWNSAGILVHQQKILIQ